MFVTVVAVMCRIIVADPTIAPSGDCTAEEQMIEEIVTDTNLDPRVDMFSCHVHAQINIADWKNKHPIYRKEAWRVARIRCAPGHYEPRGAI